MSKGAPYEWFFLRFLLFFRRFFVFWEVFSFNYSLDESLQLGKALFSFGLVKLNLSANHELHRGVSFCFDQGFK